MAAQNSPVLNADEQPCLPHTATLVLDICSSAHSVLQSAIVIYKVLTQIS